MPEAPKRSRNRTPQRGVEAQRRCGCDCGYGCGCCCERGCVEAFVALVVVVVVVVVAVVVVVWLRLCFYIFRSVVAMDALSVTLFVVDASWSAASSGVVDGATSVPL